MPVTSTTSAPYAPAKAVLEIVSRYRSKGLSQPIDGDVLSRVGITESLVPRTLQALQTLDLLDDKGFPTATFESIRLAPEAEYKERLAHWLNAAYADVLNSVDPRTADETALQDAFRSYNPPGQRPRMVTLFVGLYAAAGMGKENPRSRSGRPNNAAGTPHAQNAVTRQNIKGPTEQKKPAIGHPDTNSESRHRQANSNSPQDDQRTLFERDLLAKFPSFDPGWSDDLKAKWFEGFEKFMTIASPKA